MSTRINIRNGRVELGFPQGRGPKGDKGDKGDTGEVSNAELTAALADYRRRNLIADGEPMVVYTGNPWREEVGDTNASFFGYDINSGAGAVRVNARFPGLYYTENNIWRVRIEGNGGSGYGQHFDLMYSFYLFSGNAAAPHIPGYSERSSSGITAQGSNYDAIDGSLVLWWEQTQNYFQPAGVSVEMTPILIATVPIIPPTVEWYATQVGTAL